MPSRAKVARPVVCPICSAVMPAGQRPAHIAAEHPGHRVARDGWSLVVTDPEGSERRFGPRELAELRAAAVAKSKPRPAPEPEPEPEPEAEPTIDEGRRPFAWQTPTTPPLITRTIISEALTERALATMIQQLSATLSDWDGAGAAGTLSAIESVQLASLFYDSTLGIIERYFRGSVDRFKLTIGLAILMLGKGRIHLAAIAAKRRGGLTSSEAVNAAAELQGDEAGADSAYELEPAFVPSEAAQDGPGRPPAPEPPSDPWAGLRARQLAWAEGQQHG